MTDIRGRIFRLLLTPFSFAVLGCLVLAGWALWSGGLLDGPAARQVRTSSVYVAPGVDVDRAAAEKIIGNRRLVVLFLEPGADVRAGCDGVERAAAGTLVLVLSRADDGFDTYSCSGYGDDSNLGKRVVAETTIGSGVDEFVDRPLDAVRVTVVNYDRLVKADALPDGARTISPSLPRYLVAAAAVGAVLAGTVILFVVSRRAGRLAAARRARRDQATDGRTELSAATAAVAQQIIDLDRRYARALAPDSGRRPVAANRSSPPGIAR